ncbi:SEUSS transcriptional co-regulator [Striga asiatica]|uniref:SEUSS transcriptional co-regulator n=1 Tax=Striga asiatica TaxID=4170 RepID=A0A5A7QKV9_STRAF|nr:SEUSS transcriptional co-regulator [Striga asiatica]
MVKIWPHGSVNGENVPPSGLAGMGPFPLPPYPLNHGPTHPPTTHTRNRSRSLAGRSSTPLHAGSSCVRPAAPPLHQDGWFRFRGCAGAVKPAGRNGRRRAELHLEAGGQVTDAAAADPDRERCVLTGNANFVSRGVSISISPLLYLLWDAAAAVAAKGKAVVGQGRRPLQARINSKRSRLAIEGAPAPKTPPSSILQKFKSMGFDSIHANPSVLCIFLIVE